MNFQRPICIGIDLGTTYSSVSYYDFLTNKPMVIHNGSGFQEFPSWVAVTGEDMDVIVGEAAKSKNGFEFVFYDSKRLIGKTYEEYRDMGSEKKNWTFKVKCDDDDDDDQILMESLKPNGESLVLLPEQISAFVINEALRMIERSFPTSIIGAVVVTIPVDFDMTQRKATQRACQIAGIDYVELLHKPSASIIEYQRKFPLKDNSKVLVIDFGGGTLDVCCCVIKGDNIEVIANGGDQDLGGNNFDQIMMDLIVENCIEDGQIKDVRNFFYKTEKESEKEKKLKALRRSKLRSIAEKTKIQLSRNEEVEINGEELFGEEYCDINIYITQEEFEEKCLKSEFLKKFENKIKKVLGDAKKKNDYFTVNNLDLVLPIGGSCSIPLVRNRINNIFMKKSILANKDFDPLVSAAKGAAKRAYDISMRNTKSFVDIIPFSLGIEVSGERNDIFAHKGDVLPIECKKRYHFAKDNTNSVSYKIFQGESERCTSGGMKEIESMTFTGISLNTNERYFPMYTIFKINTSGILEVEVINQQMDYF